MKIYSLLSVGAVAFAASLSAQATPTQPRAGAAGDAAYTVYFYDTTGGTQSSPHLYVWQASPKQELSSWASAPAMEKTGKYVHVDGEYYPVWAYSFDWQHTPSNLIVHNGSGLKYTTNTDCPFVNGGFYYSNSSAPRTGLNLVDRPTDAGGNVLYMHFKYDLEEEGRDGKNTVPYCHVYKSGPGEDTNVLYPWLDNRELMTKVDDIAAGDGKITERYAIWKFEIPADRVKDFDAAIFIIPEKNNNLAKYPTAKYAVSGAAVPGYDRANWTRYIYATAADGINGYACQSYMPYSMFKLMHDRAQANRGREAIYLCGEGNNFTYHLDDGRSGNFTYDLMKSLEVLPDGGCFYIPVIPGEQHRDFAGSDSDHVVGNKFKISWVSVPDAVKRAGASSDDDNFAARTWATFDLGLIGIDKDHRFVVSSDAYKRGKGYGPSGRTLFTVNKSLPYMHYNQGDWVIPQSDKMHWIVIDTHYSATDPDYRCETATVTSFDPHPSLGIGEPRIEQGNLHDDHLHGFTVDEIPLRAESSLGSLDKSDVNFASAEAAIYGTENSEVLGADFIRKYELTVDGKPYGSVEGNVSEIFIDLIPFDESGNLAIRSRYLDRETGLKFHSRTGDTNFFGGDAVGRAPSHEQVSARYVLEKTADDGLMTFGVVFSGFNSNIDSRLHVYSDFEILDLDGNDLTHSVELFTADHPMAFIQGMVPLDLPYWQPAHEDNWSYSFKESVAPITFYIPAMATVAHHDDLPGKTFRILSHAVYPFVYDPEATPQPHTAARADRKLMLHNTYATTEMTVDINSSTVTGIEDIVTNEPSADGPAEYYTLSGVRVSGNPAPGVYICRRGDTVTKVVIW